MGWVRSKPVYPPLSETPGASRYILASHGEAGARALSGLRAAGDVIHLHSGPGSPEHAIALRSAEFLFARLESVLRESPAGAALYGAGPEQFVWKCHRIGRDCGMSRYRIQVGLAGTAARSVYCVHCKALTPDVTTSTLACGGCGQTLLVRDHFSRLMAAYAGFRIDSETPGDVPEAEILYS